MSADMLNSSVQHYSATEFAGPDAYNEPVTSRATKVLASLVVIAMSGVTALSQAPLTRTHLEAFTYDLGASASVVGGKVPLTNGTWTDVEGGGTFTLHPTHAIGDLDGDRAPDAVAILIEASGGTGSFYYMFALMNRGGTPVQLAEPEWLGDRTVIERLTIDRKGVISVRYVTHADNDPACCPTMKVEDRYRVEDGKLIGITKLENRNNSDTSFSTVNLELRTPGERFASPGPC
jgi:hypothetical protein